MPVRKSQIRKFSWLIHKSQIRKFLQNTAQPGLKNSPKSRLLKLLFVEILNRARGEKVSQIRKTI